MLTLTRPAERLQRALEGDLEAAPSGAIGGYVAVAERLRASVPTTALRPDPAFRAELHQRLVALAIEQAAARPAADRVRPPAAVRLERGGERRWWQARRLRAAYGLVTAAMALVVGVGVASAGALPGGVLYPVKEIVQGAQVRLADAGLDRGTVQLGQARGHIADARTLVGLGSPDPADIRTALGAASNDLTDARGVLLGLPGDQLPAGLSALARFATGQAPVLAELRGRVPVESEPMVDALIAQLGQTANDVRTAASTCGAPCALVPVSALPAADGTPTTTGAAGGAAGTGSTFGRPGTTTDLGTLLGTPGSTGGGGGPAIGLGTPSAGKGTIGLGGVSVNAPGVGATVPGVTAGAGPGGVQATVPKATATVGKITATLPGVGITVPPLLPTGKSSSSHHTAASSSSSSSVCVLVICVG